jgi:hypothetical protein
VTLELKNISSPGELVQYLQKEAEKASSAADSYTRQLEDVKIQAEQEKKTKEVIAKLIGRNKSPRDETRGQEAKLDAIEVLVNPYPEQQQTLIEDLLESQQTKLNAIDKVKKAIEPLLKEKDVGMALSVIISNGVPIKLIINTEPTTSIEGIPSEPQVVENKIARPVSGQELTQKVLQMKRKSIEMEQN